jgi:hypothetical protein
MISAELCWTFMVGATELAFAAGMTRMTLLPGLAITSRGCVETGSPRAFLASTAGSIGAHPVIIKLPTQHEASHALWRAITEGA